MKKYKKVKGLNLVDTGVIVRRVFTSQHIDLMSKNEDFALQRGARPEQKSPSICCDATGKRGAVSGEL